MRTEIGELLSKGAVPNLGTDREQIEYIDIDLIDGDERNFYDLPDIEALAASIELIGLQQPLRVRDGEGDRVTVVSGHRRRAALRLLVDEGKEQFRAVPCIREREAGSPTLQELRLIYGNADTREKTAAEKAKEVERVTFLLYQLKEEGVEFPGRMRDHVAEVCKISKSKLARLKVIQEGLIPAYYAKFEADELPEQTAHALARFPKEFQQRLHDTLKNLPTGGRAEELLKHYDEGWRWEPSFSCPDGKPCKRGDTFLRHDAECLSYELCGGQKCCLDCPRAFESCYACDRACSKVQAKRKEKRDEAAEKEEKRKAKQQKEYKAAIQASAQRLVAAIDRAGLEDKVGINTQNYYPELTVAQIRAYAAGDFGDKYFYGNDLDATHFSNVAKVARQLCCSADYLLGLTDDLHGGHGAEPPADEEAAPPADEEAAPPAEAEISESMAPQPCGAQLNGWRTGTPEEGQLAVVEDGDCKTFKVGIFGGSCWCEHDMYKLRSHFEIKNPGKWLPFSAPGSEPEVQAPEWGWTPEVPKESGLYWGITGPMKSGGGLYWWNAEDKQWEHPGVSGFPLKPAITIWMPCPELPESMAWNREVVTDE